MTSPALIHQTNSSKDDYPIIRRDKRSKLFKYAHLEMMPRLTKAVTYACSEDLLDRNIGVNRGRVRVLLDILVLAQVCVNSVGEGLDHGHLVKQLGLVVLSSRLGNKDSLYSSTCSASMPTVFPCSFIIQWG